MGDASAVQPREETNVTTEAMRLGVGPTIGSAAPRDHPLAAYTQSDLESLRFYMMLLMLRNITTAGFVFEDPVQRGSFSLPGCVVAAPSFPANTPGVDQDYVYNWVRDAAITMVEIAESGLPGVGGEVEILADYVDYATTCFSNAQPTKAHACFTVAGKSRPWTEQSDGPALQSIALMRAYNQLDAASQASAVALIDKNIAYLMGGVYQQPTTNLWEEHLGHSFFARSAQLKCFRLIATNKVGAAVPAGLPAAIAWLESALASHWNGTYYVSVMDPNSAPPRSVAVDYDANIDIVQACIYGAIPCTDTKLLASAAILRSQWSDPNSPNLYRINIDDQARGLGPLFGRYPGDVYDGDVAQPVRGGHPWALCTANFAEFQYMLASKIIVDKKVPLDSLSRAFFTPLGIDTHTTPADAAALLRASSDAMLRAIIFHSDRYELSEQFDGTRGYEKSVHNLTWSYAAFLSALRARQS
jgi:glucoamylase